MTAKERIIEEATQLFFQRGVRNVTMNDLAMHLGMSKRTIYENVNDKDELLAECLNHFEKCEDNDLSNGDRIIDILKKVIEASTSTHASDMGNFMMEIKRYHPVVFKNNVEKYQQKRFEKTCIFLEKGIVEGFFKPDTDVKMMSQILINMFTSIGERWFDLGYTKQQIPQLFKTMFIMYCRGIATLKGVKEIDDNLL